VRILQCITLFAVSLKVHKLRYFTAKGKSMSQLHISVSAVHCCCQHSTACRVCARLISQLKFIGTVHCPLLQ